MERSTVSVIIPVYRSEEYLSSLLQDLMMQTYENLEIIIINDGSPDNSQLIIEEYASKDKRIQYIKTDNLGVSKARNKGLELATGKYIRFVDADDRIPENSIKLLVEAMEEDEEIDIVFGVYKDLSDRQLYTGNDNSNKKVLMEEMLQHFVMYIRTFYYGVVWNKLYKREIIQKYNLRFQEDIFWCEDFLFNLEYYDKCKYIYYLDNTKKVYTYIEHKNSTMEKLGREEHKNDERVKRIDELRKKRARELFCRYGLEKEFNLYWEYAFLYLRLLILGKSISKNNITCKYEELRKILQEDGVVDYVELKVQLNPKESIWKYVYKAIVNKRYLGLFGYLYVRGLMSKYFCCFKPILQSLTNKRKPKSL